MHAWCSMELCEPRKQGLPYKCVQIGGNGESQLIVKREKGKNENKPVFEISVFEGSCCSITFHSLRLFERYDAGAFSWFCSLRISHCRGGGRKTESELGNSHLALFKSATPSRQFLISHFLPELRNFFLLYKRLKIKE